MHLYKNNIVRTIIILTFTLFSISNVAAFAQYGGGTGLGDGSGAIPSGPTSGSTNFTNNAGDSRTITSPLAGVDDFIVTFNQSVTNGTITYALIPQSSLVSNTAGCAGLLQIQFTYVNIDKTKINIKVDFKVKSSYSQISACYYNSPGVSTPVTTLGTDASGNKLYSAAFQGSSQFSVGGTSATETVRSGGFDTLKQNSTIVIVGVVLAIAGITLIVINRKPNQPKVQR